MEPKITDYKILTHGDVAELSQKVREHISKGWQPQGAAIMATGQESGWGTDTYFAQTMVKFAVIRKKAEKS